VNLDQIKKNHGRRMKDLFVARFGEDAVDGERLLLELIEQELEIDFLLDEVSKPTA